MSIKFSPHPGPRERQLRRCFANPLFPVDEQNVSEAQIEEARHADETELNHFLRYFRDLVQEAIELKPEAESETILALKERLDKCYTHCCALPGEQSEIQAAINKLIEVIMKAVRQGAANDPIALDKLTEEEQARQMHHELHQYTLVADLMLPDSPINKDQLVATLLSEPETGLNAALALFDEAQLEQIYLDATSLVAQLPQTTASHTNFHDKIKLLENTLNALKNLPFTKLSS
ncbi:hypothetical protein MNBD_GAMMA25-1094 [hydrothermal vent metagenome]|uniref:Uncharacterized protein n=1 Tax=hydrothermal vent metagenome TaxID=652676 RepID=A0A3B1B193_9ZZZZ